MVDIKFDPKKLAKLNDPARLKIQPPQAIWDALELAQAPTCLVDIGAGTGFFAKEFIKFMPQGQVYALDIKDVMLAWMSENLAEVREGRITPVKMDESQTPLADQVADLVCMINLHHELHDPQALLKDCLRILKPGGKLLIIDWLPIETPMGPPLEIRLSPGQILGQLLQAGYDQTQSKDFMPMHSFVLGSKPLT